MGRPNLRRATSLGIVMLLAAAGTTGAQKLYKWTDKDGKVHFSNVAPPGQEGAEESSGVTGIEASGSSEGDAPPAEAPSVNVPGMEMRQAPAETASASISDEAFSTKVTATRLRLKREIARAKEDVQAAEEQIASAKRDRDAAQKPGIEMLQNAFDPAHQHDSKDIDELEKKRDKAKTKVEDIRKQYDALREEAAKRNGGSTPSWWLPIE